MNPTIQVIKINNLINPRVGSSRISEIARNPRYFKIEMIRTSASINHTDISATLRHTKSSELLKIKRQTKTWLQFPLEASLQTIIILPSSSSSSSSSHPSMSHPPLLPDAAILRIKVYLRKSPTSMDTYTELFTSVCCETYDALYTSIYTHTCKLVRLNMIRCIHHQKL